VNFTEDAILRGLVRVVQPRRGYRFSLDALLLADFALRREFSTVLDLGCGSGVIGFILAARRPEATVVGLEIQPELCEAARRGIALNGLGERVSVVEGDLVRAETLVPAGAFDLVVSNPPFFSPARGRASPDRGRALGRHALHCTIDDVLRAARHASRPTGRVAIIHPSPDLPDVSGLGVSASRAVISREGRPPRRWLVELVRSTRGRAEVLPPLVVHEGQGYTPELRRLLRDA
jgi:tRNA1(Val) A37 N6-methylase TrmN6